jgi:uncharacterized protein (TIGR00297 family)
MTASVPNTALAKAIPSARDRLQSRALVAIVAPLLCILAIKEIALSPLTADCDVHRYLALAVATSLGFAILTWAIKAATPLASFCGGLVCFLLIMRNSDLPPSLSHSGLPPLVLLFFLTFAATRYGRSKKEARGLAEARNGRRASQVIANLGVAGLCTGLSHQFPSAAAAVIAVAAIAALAEATADTVSSEVGQAIGGYPFLITSLRRVPPGTDGAISLVGTFAGLLGAAAVAFVTVFSFGPALRNATFAAIFIGAVAGLFFDSLLGATLERSGYLGNDLVNFTSTAFAAATAGIAIKFCQNLLPH